MRHMQLRYVVDPHTGIRWPIPAGGADDGPDDGTDDHSTDGDGADDGDPEQLGDAGKKALDAERRARRDAEKAAKAAADKQAELEAELASFREDAMSEQEKAIEQARKEAAEAARTEVLTEVRGKRLATEIKAAATGKFADPADAVAFLAATDDLDPDDAEAIEAAIDELLEQKPHLKASATRAGGDIDQGTRETDNGAKQLSRQDLKTMSPEQIAAARARGQLRDLMSTGR